MPSDYEEAFWDEIWGCVNYIKLPYDTVMRMPVCDRKVIIHKHNGDVEKERKRSENGNSNTINGEALNTYAEMEMKKQQNERHP